ncbi:MAG: hypothetical protein IJA61_03305 [Clostridia bacterium]|nr:hypothetical protein [Clostridia bacterium]
MKLGFTEDKKEKLVDYISKITKKHNRFVTEEDIIGFVENRLEKKVLSRKNGILVLMDGGTVVADDYNLLLNSDDHIPTDCSIAYRNYMSKVIEKKSASTFKYSHEYALGALAVVSRELEQVSKDLQDAKLVKDNISIMTAQARISELVMQYEMFNNIAFDKSIDIPDLRNDKRRKNMRKFVTDDMLKDYLSYKGCSKPTIMQTGGFVIDKNGSHISFEADDFKFKMFFNPKKNKPFQRSDANYSYQYMDFMSDALIKAGSKKAGEYLVGAISTIGMEIEDLEQKIEEQNTPEDIKHYNFRLESAKMVKTSFENKFNNHFGIATESESADDNVM